MIRLLADENLDGRILRALSRSHPEVDIVRAQDVGLYQTPDPIVLEWAAENDRILVTHDQETVPAHLQDRLDDGLLMPGVFLLRPGMPVSQAVEALVFMNECSEHSEWIGRMEFLPY